MPGIAVAIATPSGGDRDYVDARALVRVGTLVLVVALQDRRPGDQAAELASLSAMLAARTRALLAASPE